MFILPFTLLGAQRPLRGFWSSQNLGILCFHLEASEGETAETLRLTWTAGDAARAARLLLKGWENQVGKCYSINAPLELWFH